MGGVDDPKKHAPPHMCYLAEYGRLGPPSVKWWRGWPPRNTPLPIHVKLPNLVARGSNGTSIIKEICLKSLTPRVPPLKVTQYIGTDADRSATYEWLLLTFHSNHGLSRNVSEIVDQKIGLGLAHCGLGIAGLVLCCETRIRPTMNKNLPSTLQQDETTQITRLAASATLAW